MTHIAYLRVSTGTQDTTNQKRGILEYCNGAGLSSMEFVEDIASGTVPWRESKLGRIIEDSGKGDVIVFVEILQIGRTVLDVLDVLKRCAEREIDVHIAKQKMRLDGSLNSKDTVYALTLVAQIEFVFTRPRSSYLMRS